MKAIPHERENSQRGDVEEVRGDGTREEVVAHVKIAKRQRGGGRCGGREGVGGRRRGVDKERSDGSGEIIVLEIELLKSRQR
jgi:hypothetical protein